LIHIAAITHNVMRRVGGDVRVLQRDATTILRTTLFDSTSKLRTIQLQVKECETSLTPESRIRDLLAY